MLLTTQTNCFFINFPQKLSREIIVKSFPAFLSSSQSFQLHSTKLLDEFFTSACFLVFWKVLPRCCFLCPPAPSFEEPLLHKTAVFKWMELKTNYSTVKSVERNIRIRASTEEKFEWVSFNFCQLCSTVHSIVKILCATEAVLPLSSWEII